MQKLAAMEMLLVTQAMEVVATLSRHMAANRTTNLGMLKRYAYFFFVVLMDKIDYESCLALSTWTEKNAGRSPHFVDFHLTFTTSTE